MNKIFTLLAFMLFPFCLFAQSGKELLFQKWALTPPMGWNSWDCYGPSVVESEVKANADYMAKNLKPYGWEYVVVDIRWYVDNQTSGTYNSYNNSTFVYDEYGRYMPSTTRFPSAADGKGFKPLADYIHSLGLKFGIHIMRGIPKKAVSDKLPIKGTSLTAADIYSSDNLCTWLSDNYTVDASKAGAQEYYNSIFDLYADWGVDFVKVDDLSRPYHDDEINLIRNAIDQTGRPIVLSMSPGATPLDSAEHAGNHANMWRTIDDFWDSWTQLNYSFSICANWAPYIKPGNWPDADMLPLGHLCIRGERGVDRQTSFTEDEQYTLMSLWGIFKSPLMFGGNLPDNDDFTTSLITNEELLDMHKTSVNNKQLYNENDMIAWTADDPRNGDKYMALFNYGGDGFVYSSKLLYRSGVLTKTTDNYGENIDVEIPKGSTSLYLLVGDGGDGYDYDHADWINPMLYLSNGDSIDLTTLNYEYASVGYFDSPGINQSVSGGSLIVNGVTYSKGIGVHAQSVIMYEIPDSVVRFKAFGGLDVAGIGESGATTSLEFMVSVEDPTARDVNVSKAIANSGRISRTYQNEGVTLTADIAGADTLYMVVTDAGDNYNYDHADWIQPTLYKDNGDSLLLTSTSWLSAESGWDQVMKNKSQNGNALTVNGKTYSNGLGCNSYSYISYLIPKGYTKFKALCGYDDEVKSASEGVTMEFMIFTTDPTVSGPTSTAVNLARLGFSDSCSIHNMWTHKDEGTYKGNKFVSSINDHGAQLYRISLLNRTEGTTINVNASATEITEGNPVTFDVNVNKSLDTTAIPTGWICLFANDSTLATIKIDSTGTIQYADTTFLPGVYSIVATYSGDTVFANQVSDTITLTVKAVSKSIPTVNLSASKNEITAGDDISYYVNVLRAADSLAIPTGSVFLYDNDSLITTLTIDNTGATSFLTTISQSGTDAVFAKYAGDDNYYSQNSDTISINVNVASGIKEVENQLSTVVVRSKNVTYLKGLSVDDEVIISDLQGRVIKSFRPTSDTEVLKGQGVIIIRVKSKKDFVKLKTCL